MPLTSKDDVPKNAIRIIVDAADAMSPTELERRPFRIFDILSVSLCFLKKL